MDCLRTELCAQSITDVMAALVAAAPSFVEGHVGRLPRMLPLYESDLPNVRLTAAPTWMPGTSPGMTKWGKWSPAS